MAGHTGKHYSSAAVHSAWLKASFKQLLCTVPYARRYNKFQIFFKKHMRLSKPYDLEQLSVATLPYDTIIAESDVIWQKLSGKFDKAFFMALPSMKSLKKIAYAPDIGNLILDDFSKIEISHYLKNIDFISCRNNVNFQ